MSLKTTVINLGCSKNLVDSEIILARLSRMGYRPTSDPAEAALIVVNTCGFLQSAVEEAIETLLEMSQYKPDGSCRILVGVGCMVQRYGKKLLALLPEVDLLIGTDFYHQLDRIIEEYLGGNKTRLWISRPSYLPHHFDARIVSTSPSSAYLKIAEGCGNHCSFCLIPHLRGPLRSRTVDDVYREAVSLAASGIRELVLIAQDTTAFGYDRGDPTAFIRLLERLDTISELSWIRIMYSYPAHVTKSLLETMAGATRIVPYLDIPMQHCVPKILRSMYRDEPGFDPRMLIEQVRAIVPDVTLRTTLMVGFPGETERDFEKLMRFVEWAQFDHLGAFIFSPEPGCRAAKYPGQVRNIIAKQRYRELFTLQREISAKKLKRLVGQTCPVLIEGPHPETDYLLHGRLASQAPEVDGGVLITRGTGVAGQIMPVAITASHSYDVEGVLIEGDLVDKTDAQDTRLSSRHE